MERDDCGTGAAACGKRVCRIDLRELTAVYDEASIARLLSQSLDHLDAQWASFDACAASGQWRSAAEVLHSVKGTFAFLCHDAKMLAPISAAEMTLRMRVPTDAAPCLNTVRRTLALYRAALCDAIAAGARD